MKNNATLPADPDLTAAMRLAQQVRLEAYDSASQFMHECLALEPHIMTGDEIELDSGDVVNYIQPQYLAQQRAVFEVASDVFIAQLNKVTTLEEQRVALIDGAQVGLHTSLFTEQGISEYTAMMNFLYDAKDHYLNHASRAQKLRMQPILMDMAEYVNLCVDARKIICQQCKLNEETKNGDSLSDPTLYDIALKRFGQHYPLKARLQKFTAQDNEWIMSASLNVLKEIMAPYEAVLPEPILPEMMGLVYRAAETHSKQDDLKFLPEGTDVANDNHFSLNAQLQSRVCRELEHSFEDYQALGKYGRDSLIAIVRQESKAQQIG
jgi:hypothetical protein